MNAARALLDKLMGEDRNEAANSAKQKEFSDPTVCKYYLTGMCPHDMLVNTVRLIYSDGRMSGCQDVRMSGCQVPFVVLI